MRRLLFSLLLIPSAAFALTDPFGPPAWQANGTQKDGEFGVSVTTAGDVDGDGYNDLVVGAEFEDSTLVDEGAAYLFRGSKNGPSLTPSWVYHGRQSGAFAGSAVCSAGDVNNDGYADVLVAVPFWDTPAHPNAGKVVVFHGGPNGLSPTPAYELFSPVPSDDERFGTSIAPAGDVNGDGYADVIIGTSRMNGGFVVGSAHVFEGGVAGLFPSPQLSFLGAPGANSFFGNRVSGAGDVNADGFADFIIGSPGLNSPFPGCGGAYVFLGAPTFDEAPLDTILTGSQNASFGSGVSVAGDVNGDGYSDVIVGAPGFGTNTGKAIIAYGGPNGVTSTVDLPNPGASVGEFIGFIVSTLGDLNGDGFADVGVLARNQPGNRGRVSVYLGTRGDPAYFGDILTRGPDGFFGNSLAASGDTDGDGMSEILVGTEDMDVTTGNNEGVAFMFKPPRNGLRLATGGWPRAGAQAGTGYGSALALVSRFDPIEDGKLVVGDPQFSGKGRISGHVGFDKGGVDFSESTSLLASGTFESYGAKIADVGDVYGNGFGNFVVSKPTVDNGPASQSGRVVIHDGSANTNFVSPATVVQGLSSFDRVGSALAGRGDVNGDGYQDILVGAREWDAPGKADCGKVFVFFGGAGGLAPPWERLGDVAGQGFGAGVAFADYDADGYTDVIVGSSSPVFASTAGGKVEVFYGGPAGPSNTPGVTYTTPLPIVSFGLTVAAVGDVNGDGIADIGVGAPAENGHGVARIYGGSLGRSQYPFPLVAYEGTQANERLGEAMAGGGDVDGDGIGDFVVGEPGWDGGQTDEGRFSLYYGTPQLQGHGPGLTVESDITGATLGASFAPFRDINLDGFADVMVGAPGAAGRVYAYAGGGSFGQRLELQPVDYGNGPERHTLHPNVTHDTDQIAAFFYDNPVAQGRTRLGYEIEIKPQDQAFDGVPTSQSGPSTFDFGPPGGPLPVQFTISQLTPALPGRALKMRGRWVTKNPLFPRSRWVTPEAHTSGDHDLRVLGTSVGVDPSAVAALRIDAVAPNPSIDGRSVVSFTLPYTARVTLDLYDVRGARVRRLLDETRRGGSSSVAWDGRDDSGRGTGAGIYLVVLRAGREVERTKLVRLP